MKLSVVIITLNAEDTIERCMDSVRRIADEILVIDSYSKDFTARIASYCGAKVIQHEFSDYVSQRNFAVAEASHDWVLCIDADEAISRELEISIKSTMTISEHEYYQVSRINNYRGKWVRFGCLHSKSQVRLFNRTKGKWRGRSTEEQWRPFKSALPVGKLNGTIYHYPIESWENYRSKIELDACTLAKMNFQSGKNFSWLSQFLLPIYCFIKGYFFKLGCLDLLEGFQAAKMYALKKHLVIQKTRSFLSNCSLPDGSVFSEN